MLACSRFGWVERESNRETGRRMIVTPPGRRSVDSARFSPEWENPGSLVSGRWLLCRMSHAVTGAGHALHDGVPLHFEQGTRNWRGLFLLLTAGWRFVG